MANLRDFFNKISNDNRIFTAEDIGEMSSSEFSQNEKAIDYQLAHLGVPKNSDIAQSDDVIYVSAYVRDDGTKVRAHYRSKNGNISNKNTNVLANEMTSSEKIADKLGYFISKPLTVAGANLQNARRDFEYAKNNNNAHIMYRYNINNKGLNEVMNIIGIPKNSRGVIYDINSKQSKKIFYSPEIQDYILKNSSKLIKNEQETVSDINFTIKQNFKGIDNYLGLQHCKLYNPHITSDGYFSGIVIDYYDFEYRPLKGSIKNRTQNYINNWGYSMQEKGLLENQFNIYQIREKLW